MDATGAGFDEALAEATALGYAEADPTADVDGYDAAAKAAILAGLAFHTRVTMSDVHREGIGEVTAADMASARAMDCTVKLLAICERIRDADGTERVAVRTHPAMIPRTHPLAGVGDAFNAVFVEAEAAGSLMFYGRGAGGAPDGQRRARRPRRGGPQPGQRQPGQRARAPTPTCRSSRWARSAPGTTSPSTSPTSPACSPRSRTRSPSEGVSIQTVRQEGRGDAATLVLVTHSATDAALDRTVTALAGMPFVRRAASVMRVEGMVGD